MMGERNVPAGPRQRGAALVEFAFVLPLLLVLLVGVIYYGYAFMLQAAVTHAAKQAAQVAVAVEPLGLEGEAYRGLVAAEADQAVRNTLAWLPGSVRAGLAETVVVFPEGERVRVQVGLSTAGGGGGLLPQVRLPMVGAVPPLPSTLTGVAEVAL